MRIKRSEVAMAQLKWEGVGSGSFSMSLPGFSYYDPQTDRSVTEPYGNVWPIASFLMTYDTELGLLETFITTGPNPDCDFGGFECPEFLSEPYSFHTVSDERVYQVDGWEQQALVLSDSGAIQEPVRRIADFYLDGPYQGTDWTNNLVIGNGSYSDYNEGPGLIHPTYGGILPDIWINWGGNFQPIAEHHSPEPGTVALLFLSLVVGFFWRGPWRQLGGGTS
jgi:hypothetical protein